MKRMVWKSDYNTGNNGVDDQHQELFRLANLMLYACEESDDLKLFNKSYQALLRYTEEHFKYEETCMEDVKFQSLELHRLQHKTLYHELRNLWPEIQEPGMTSMPKSCAALRNWLTGRLIVHIKMSDTAMISTIEPTVDEALSA